ncbi:MAG TPA: hypothetical protein ENI29_21945 [bacterium]|nr:hypothetical protein [bacterium]
MRDKRAIIIKDKKLRRIRDSFRDIFFQAIRLERKKLREQRRKLMFTIDGVRLSVDDLSFDNLRQFRGLQDREDLLSNKVRRSILMCVTCGKGDRDMVYNKAYGAWYCTECYGLERLTALERAKLKEVSESCDEQAIREHSKTFL